MQRTLTQHAVSFSLALLVTVGTLFGLNVLAGTDHSAAQQIAAAKAAQA
jgi:hypothetical protein